MYCLFECHLGTQVLYQISRAHSAAYYSHSSNILLPSHNTCRIHVPPRAPCNNLVVHQRRNEILTGHGCETMFFDEGSMKLKRAWNSVMNYRCPTAQPHSSITAVFIYINCQKSDAWGVGSCTRKHTPPWWSRKRLGRSHIWIKNGWHRSSLLAFSSNNLPVSERFHLCVCFCGRTLTRVSSESGLAGA